jgi:hypothetical protein
MMLGTKQGSHVFFANRELVIRTSARWQECENQLRDLVGAGESI